MTKPTKGGAGRWALARERPCSLRCRPCLLSRIPLAPRVEPCLGPTVGSRSHRNAAARQTHSGHRHSRSQRLFFFSGIPLNNRLPDLPTRFCVQRLGKQTFGARKRGLVAALPQPLCRGHGACHAFPPCVPHLPRRGLSGMASVGPSVRLWIFRGSASWFCTCPHPPTELAPAPASAARQLASLRLLDTWSQSGVSWSSPGSAVAGAQAASIDTAPSQGWGPWPGWTCESLRAKDPENEVQVGGERFSRHVLI